MVTDNVSVFKLIISLAMMASGSYVALQGSYLHRTDTDTILSPYHTTNFDGLRRIVRRLLTTAVRFLLEPSRQRYQMDEEEVQQIMSGVFESEIAVEFMLHQIGPIVCWMAAIILLTVGFKGLRTGSLSGN
jgi:hypothetical protein